MPGSYVSVFSPDISTIPYDKPIIAGWQKDNPKLNLGPFGPAQYLSVQVALNAVKRACDIGKGQITDRRVVARNVKRIFIKNSILGGNFRFSTKSNDPLNGGFYIFEIQSDGSYKDITASTKRLVSDEIRAARPRRSGRPCVIPR